MKATEKQTKNPIVETIDRPVKTAQGRWASTKLALFTWLWA